MPSLATSVHSTAGTAPAPAATVARAASRRVIDAPTRMFHWLFALSFVGAYATAESESWRALHVTLGYTLVGLLIFRVGYSLLGPRQAGLGQHWRKLAAAPEWLRSVLAKPWLESVNWRHGQNLAMAAAVVALLLMVLPLALSGWLTYESWGGDWLEEVHEFFGQTFLSLVLAHLALIVGISLLRRRNQALPMLTGRQEGGGPDLVKDNRRWLATLLLAAAAGFSAWQWQQFPNGLLPAGGGAEGLAQERLRDKKDHHHRERQLERLKPIVQRAPG